MIKVYKTCVCTVAILLSSLSVSSQTIQISHDSSLSVDGTYEDWNNHTRFSFPTDSVMWKSNSEINQEDLSIDMKIATNKNGLYFLLRWSDDIIDTESIPKDSSIVTTKTGSRMDRMYLYDNLKIQIRTDSTNHVTWLKPDENSIQWSSLRKKGDSWYSVDISDPEFNYKSDNSVNMLETMISWDQIGIRSNEYNLLIILNDTDLNNATESSRLAEQRSYVTLSTKVKLRQ